MDGLEKQTSPTAPGQPLYTDEMSCGTLLNPCKIEGVWAVASKYDPTPPPGVGLDDLVPCSTVAGGCFPPNQGPEFGDEARGQYGTFQSPGGRYDDTADVPDSHKQMEMEMLIDSYGTCPEVRNLLKEMLSAGLIRLVEGDLKSGALFGEYEESDNTIYIDYEEHYWPGGEIKDDMNLAETLIHEGIHAWFGASTTDHEDPTQKAAFDSAFAACFN